MAGFVLRRRAAWGQRRGLEREGRGSLCRLVGIETLRRARFPVLGRAVKTWLREGVVLDCARLDRRGLRWLVRCFRFKQANAIGGGSGRTCRSDRALIAWISDDREANESGRA